MSHIERTMAVTLKGEQLPGVPEEVLTAVSGDRPPVKGIKLKLKSPLGVDFRGVHNIKLGDWRFWARIRGATRKGSVYHYTLDEVK